MSAGHSNREIEIKLRVPNAAAARRLLRANGFRVRRKRVFETNCVLDTDAGDLSAAGCLLRVRRAGPVCTLTFKGPSAAGKHKSREELEITVSDDAAARMVLARLGFAPVFLYEKYRTEYIQPGRQGLVTLDETPIGTFLELEGAPAWIDRTASSLGFEESSYITMSYGRLYQLARQQTPPLPRDMRFPTAAQTE